MDLTNKDPLVSLTVRVDYELYRFLTEEAMRISAEQIARPNKNQLIVDVLTEYMNNAKEIATKQSNSTSN
jgi:hypothetical protein